MTISEWADRYRRLSSESSAEPGQWLTRRAEYQRGIMDAVSEDDRPVVIMTSAQVGKTEILNNVAGFHIAQDPSPILVLMPTLEMAETWSKDRLAPMLRDTPCLRDKVADPRSRDSGNTIRHKRFNGGHLTSVGANSPSDLSSRPIRVVLADEVDRYPPSAGAEGDPLSLAIKRTTTFWNRRVVMASTPTIKGFSRIEREWEASDQRRYFVVCPHCSHEQHLIWSQVHWPKGRPEEARYHCAECSAGWSDSERRAAIRWGKWVVTKPGARKVGFHLNELYSPWSTVADVALAFYAAKDSRETLKTWTNTALGEPFEDIGDRVDEHALMARAEDWGKWAPERVLVVTCGVDVQDDRLEVERIGWGVDEESWSIDHKILYGDPSAPQLWNELDAYLLTPTRTIDGRLLEVRAAAIDSGGHYTQTVYKFTKARMRRKVWAIKGQGGEGKPVWPKRAAKNVPGRYLLFMVGVDTAKTTIYARLRITEEGKPGYCHLPRNRDKAWFEQLTSETVITKYEKGFPKRIWQKRDAARNEALDLRVYGYAAFLSLNVVWPHELKRAAAAPRSPAPSEEVEPVLEPDDEALAAPTPKRASPARPKATPALPAPTAAPPPPASPARAPEIKAFKRPGRRVMRSSFMG